MKIAYFGGAPLGIPVLETLLEAGITPNLVVTAPDRPGGRGQKLQENDLKTFALENTLKVLQPETLRSAEVPSELESEEWDLFVVVAYPKILPTKLIEIPKHGTLNLHPSLLPKYRGVSPIRSAILNDDRETGVSVMLLDEEMDHGPIVVSRAVDINKEDWPIPGLKLDEMMAEIGGQLLATSIPAWIAGDITPQEQDHKQATYTQKFTRQDGELAIDPHNLPSGDEAYQTLLKIRAFDGFPGTFFIHNGKRIKIVDAKLSSTGALEILSVRPEGKGTVGFNDWLNSQ